MSRNSNSKSKSLRNTGLQLEVRGRNLALESLQRQQQAALAQRPKRKDNGLAEAAVISEFLHERNNINTTDVEERFKEMSCLDFLAFVKPVTDIHDKLNITRGATQTTQGTPVKFQMDERVPIMISVGITRVLCNIIHSVQPKVTIDPNSGDEKGFYDSEKLMNKAFEMLKMSTDTTAQSIGVTSMTALKSGNKGIKLRDQITKLFTIKNNSTAGNFAASLSLDSSNSKIDYNLREAVKNYLDSDKGANYTYTTNYKESMISVFTLIAAIVIAFTFLRYYDMFFVTADDNGTDVTDYENGILFNRTMTWPTLTAILESFGTPWQQFDSDMAEQIKRIKEVREVFLAAYKTYDEGSAEINAVTSKPRTMKPRLFMSEQEKDEAKKQYDKVAKKTTGPLQVEGKAYRDPTTNELYVKSKDRKDLAQLYARQELGLPINFGKRRRKSSKKSRKGRKSSFGRKRKGSRKTHSRRRRVSKFGETTNSKDEGANAFGKRSKSGRKSRKSRKMRKSRKGRKSSFGKRKGSRKVSRKHRKRRSRFGSADLLAAQIKSGAQFGRKHRKSRKSHHRRRRSHGRK